jgi:hypothetical protein
MRTRRACDGYLVTESVPQRCTDRDWPDGKRSPGVTHFTWFPKPARLSDEQFFHAWHEVHTPFSFELHPLRWEYVRNAVARGLTPGAPPIRAIVAERFRTIEDYTDPRRLYGSKEVLKRVMATPCSSRDVADMHSTPLSETIVRQLVVRAWSASGGKRSRIAATDLCRRSGFMCGSRDSVLPEPRHASVSVVGSITSRISVPS